jgi:hypothetical protein
MLSPSIDARKPSPNFCISFCAVTSPMVGMRFKALSTAEDWSLADRPLGRISVHSGAAQWLHFLRYSSASSSTGLIGSPSRSVMTVPQSGHAATSPWRVRRRVKTGFQWNPIRIRTRPRTKNSWPRRHAQLLAQLDELDQRVRAVEHPDLGAGHRLLDFAPPLVDQVGRREHQVRR